MIGAVHQVGMWNREACVQSTPSRNCYSEALACKGIAIYSTSGVSAEQHQLL